MKTANPSASNSPKQKMSINPKLGIRAEIQCKDKDGNILKTIVVKGKP